MLRAKPAPRLNTTVITIIRQERDETKKHCMDSGSHLPFASVVFFQGERAVLYDAWLPALHADAHAAEDYGLFALRSGRAQVNFSSKGDEYYGSRDQSWIFRIKRFHSG